MLDLQQSQKSSAPIVGLKPYTGHMGAASDIAEIVLGLKSVTEGLVPATLNFATAEKEFYELKISGQSQISGKNAFMSVSYGLGGQSSSVVVAG
jgi:3-oxoacyl-[acyl-carrier-protein] synthase II